MTARLWWHFQRTAWPDDLSVGTSVATLQTMTTTSRLSSPLALDRLDVRGLRTIAKKAESVPVIALDVDGLGWGGASPVVETEQLPRTIGELEAFRRQRRASIASGRQHPRLDLSRLPGNPRVPPAVAQLMRAVDDLLPTLMKEKGLTLDRLFEMSSPPNARGVANRWQKTLAGAGALATGAVAVEIARMVADPTSAAVAAGSMLIGQKLAGALSYVAHDIIDEYDFMKEAFEFQVHHEDPGELGHWDFIKSIAHVGEIMVPAMGILAAVAPSLGLAPASAALAFVGALWMSPQMHKLTHLPKQRPLAEGATAGERWTHKLDALKRKAIELTQEVGLLPSKARHLEHHAGRRDGRMEGESSLAHTASFDVASGSLGVDVNEVLNQLEVSQRLKRAIYLTTKKLHEITGGATPPALEPHSWAEHPELEVLWGGDGTEAERKEAYRAFRVDRQRSLIEETRAKLSEALEKIVAAGPGVDRTAEVWAKALPDRLRRMEAQLAIFTDPRRGEQLKTRYAIEQSAYQDALDAAKALPADAQASVRERVQARVEKAKQQLEETRAQLVDVAPLLSGFKV